MVIVDRDQLASIMPASKNVGIWSGPLNAAMTRFDINTNVDFVAAFLAQIAVESAEMNRLDEALSYTAERLMVVWPKRFATLAAALPYARNPQSLANNVYANRLGNGDEASGDGWLFRGRGLIQVTGRANYSRVDTGLGLKGALIKNPDLLCEREYAALSAAFFWGDPAGRLSRLAQDLPDDDDEKDFVSITRLINGGTHGLAQRRVYWKRAKRALGR